ncbi:MAG: DUF1570 domain-containing protein [Tepidisphaeraceae bacterium]
MLRTCTLAVLALHWCAWVCAASNPVDMPLYETRYYKLYTDIDREEAKEVAIRITKMAEEYHNRTKDFSGAIKRKFAFYLFRDPEDYFQAGAPRDSHGLFNGRELLAIAGDHVDNRTWHVVQHEGFHQFAAGVIGGDIPVWANEGLAEYFGEGVFTGDGYVTGVIPNWRLKRVQKTLAQGGFRSLDAIMSLTLDQWNEEMKISNYDQAWSMVQFLAHGDDGKYQKAFASYMTLIGRGKGRAEAWFTAFGDTRGFEERWKKYWRELPQNPTDDLYARATTATLTSFLARAFAQKQTFDSFDEFLAAAKSGALKCAADDWLPSAMLTDAVADVTERMRAGTVFEIVPPDHRSKTPQVRCVLSDGTRYAGRFELRGGRVHMVHVDPDRPAGPTTRPGR